MIKHEGSIIVIATAAPSHAGGEGSDAATAAAVQKEDNEKKLLKLHPSHQI
jgi:hypothetical protein